MQSTFDTSTVNYRVIVGRRDCVQTVVVSPAWFGSNITDRVFLECVLSQNLDFIDHDSRPIVRLTILSGSEKPIAVSDELTCGTCVGRIYLHRIPGMCNPWPS